MKNMFAVITASAAVIFVSCASKEKGAFVDLRTGKEINIERDMSSGAWVNSKTGEPVYIYVDKEKNDTIYGKSGIVINGHVVQSDGKWWYDQDLDNTPDVGHKVKVESDGDTKVKFDNGQKVKLDDNEKKVKND